MTIIDPHHPVPAIAGGPPTPDATSGPDAPRRRRGRPAEMTVPQLLEHIRHLAQRAQGLYRIHHTHPDVYARARRQFGSWSRAVEAAGIDYASVVRLARTRSLRKRMRNARRQASARQLPAKEVGTSREGKDGADS